MVVSDMLSSTTRKKNIKQMINRNSNSTTLKIALFIAVVPACLVLVPLILLTSPFILAWDFVSAVFDKPSRTYDFKPLFGDDINDKWSNFIIDFNNWTDPGADD